MLLEQLMDANFLYVCQVQMVISILIGKALLLSMDKLSSDLTYVLLTVLATLVVCMVPEFSEIHRFFGYISQS